MAEIQKLYGGNVKIQHILNKFAQGLIVEIVNFQDDTPTPPPLKMGLENKLFFNLKIIDIKVKLDIRNFIRISKVEIIRPGLVKSILKLIYKH